MRFLKVNFYDNDFTKFFTDIGEKILDYFNDSYASYNISWNDEELLSYLKDAIIKMAVAEATLSSLSHYALDTAFYNNIGKQSETDRRINIDVDKKLEELKEEYKSRIDNYEEYFSKIELSLVEINNLKDIEWNNAETLYVPLDNLDQYKVFCL